MKKSTRMLTKSLCRYALRNNGTRTRMPPKLLIPASCRLRSRCQKGGLCVRSWMNSGRRHPVQSPNQLGGSDDRPCVRPGRAALHQGLRALSPKTGERGRWPGNKRCSFRRWLSMHHVLLWREAKSRWIYPSLQTQGRLEKPEACSAKVQPARQRGPGPQNPFEREAQGFMSSRAGSLKTESLVLMHAETTKHARRLASLTFDQLARPQKA